jgi:PAS domain S-box-containing protein
MKANNKNSADYSKPIPDNLDSGISIKNTIWKQMKRWKSQIIISWAVVVLVILILVKHILHLSGLLFGAPSTSINWEEIGFDLGTIFLVIFISIFLLSAIESKRKRAERALRESEKRYRTLYENAPIGIYRTTPDGRILMANPTLVRLLGFSSFDELATRNLEKEGFEATYPRSQFKELVEREGEVTGLEAAWIRRDNSVIFIRENAKAIRGEDGNILYYEGTVEDITERKKAEDALKKERHRLFSVLDVLPAYVYIQAADYSIPFVNRKFRELFGDPGDRPCYEVFHGRSEPCEDCLTLRVLKTRTSQSYEWTSKDGRVYMIFEDLFPTIDGPEMVVEVGIDITERKKAEEEIKAQSHFLESLIEQSPLPTFVIDSEGICVMVNKAFLKAYRVPQKEMVLGRNALTEPANVRQGVVKYIKEALSGKIVETPETEFISPYEDKMTVTKSRLFPIFDPTNSLTNVVVLHEDVTERKRAEEALRESEEKYRELAESISDVFFAMDRGLRYTYWNKASEKLTGILSKNALGKSLYEVFPEVKGTKAEEVYLEVLRTQQSQSFINQYQLKDNDYFFEISAYSSKDGLSVFVKDITERKRAEEALRESEQRLSTFMNSATDGILIFDSELNLVEVNKSALKMLGLNKTDVIGKNILDISPDVREKGRYDRYLKLMKSGEPFSIDNLVLHPKFGEKHLTIKAFKVGEGLGIIGTDISEEKKMKAQLIQAERLSAVGTLAYGIAHEFNNILAGILGNAEFGIESDDTEETKECFKIIMEGCDRAKGITNSLLAFSRQRETKRQRADVTQSVEMILGLVDRELEKQNINVVRKFNPIPEITCDLGELSSVVLNMITNARDAMRPKGGTLTIEIREKKDNIEMIFIDTGCGIPGSIKSRIFEPFVTTKGALGQSEIPGMGLGLFLSYGIINRYHGEIKVKSEVGKRSRFTINIPISKNQVSPALIESEEEKSVDVPQNLNILLVDDEKPICTAVKKFFEAKGHSVTTALSGKKGLEIFKKGNFDVILADITMPDMDGVELIAKLKKINQQTKFIVLTGHIAGDKLESAKKAGADEILTKPFRNEELFQAVGRVLSM